MKELQQAAARDGPGGGLGANIAFVFEGEEENGSGGFRNAVRQNMQWCGIQARAGSSSFTALFMFSTV